MNDTISKPVSLESHDFIYWLDHTNICCHDDVICTASISYFAVCMALFVIVWIEIEDFG